MMNSINPINVRKSINSSLSKINQKPVDQDKTAEEIVAKPKRNRFRLGKNDLSPDLVPKKKADFKLIIT